LRHDSPITGINHLEAHICAIFLSHPDIETPFLALVVSGGHTAIYRVDGVGKYECLGQTVDDAAGEAFDKVGKMLGFPYPAGRAIEEEARRFEGRDKLPEFPTARMSGARPGFSFSGLKTAVKYFLAEKGAEWVGKNRPLVCKSFQEAVVNSLVTNCAAAAETTGIKRIALVGGVACNTRLREALRQRLGEQVLFPPPALCVDNGAMIACAGHKRFTLGLTRFPHMDPNGSI
jgi:N6-L-threonylcarbamoyladenine synthase